MKRTQPFFELEKKQGSLRLTLGASFGFLDLAERIGEIVGNSGGQSSESRHGMSTPVARVPK